MTSQRKRESQVGQFCSVVELDTGEPCGRPAKSRGMCATHDHRTRYGPLPVGAPIRQRYDASVCSWPGCNRQRSARGLCATHDNRQRAGLDMDAPIRVRVPGRECSVDGCTDMLGKHGQYGYCPRHARAFLAHGDPLIVKRRRRPADWTEEQWSAHQKALSNERVKAHYRANAEKIKARARDLRLADPEKTRRVNEARKAYYRANPGERRAAKLRSSYGISVADFNSMLAHQECVCGICRKESWQGKGNVPHVDHDHDTGLIRGLLCTQCNKVLESALIPFGFTAALDYVANPPAVTALGGGRYVPRFLAT